MLSFTIPRIAHEQTLPDSVSPTPQPLPQATVGATSAVTSKKPLIPGILTKIAGCESGGRQFDEDGKVIRGVSHSEDVGRYQINMSVWAGEAHRLGFDLMTEEGNEAMALELYHRQGTEPWNSSKSCWGTPQK